MREGGLSFIFLLKFWEKNRGIPPRPYSPKGYSRYVVHNLYIIRPPDPLNYIVHNLITYKKIILYTT